MFYAAIASVNNVSIETFKGHVSSFAEIENDIAKQFSKRAECYCLNIFEVITAPNNSELNAKIEGGF